MTDSANQLQTTVAQKHTGTPAFTETSTVTTVLQQGTLQTVEKTTTEKEITSSDWLSVSITLWPLVAVIGLALFRKQVASLLEDLAGLTFGNFSLKLRRCMTKIAERDQFEKIKAFSAYDLKFFFVVASQSWQIGNVDWRIDVHESLMLHEKLEAAGLVVIKNKASAINDKKVVAKLTPLGEDLYQELSSLISESLR